MKIARYRDDGAAQPLSDHLMHTARWCSLFASKLGLGQTGYLAGLMHDLGKAGSLFQQYIYDQYHHPEKAAARGSVIHSTQGAQLICEMADTAQLPMAGVLAALAIASHHGTLPDCVSPDGERPFYERMSRADAALCMDEVRTYLHETFPAISVSSLLAESAAEVRALIVRAKEQGISTQLIEAGVDISLSFVVRALAGLDAVAQAAGRCNRHGEGSMAPVYIVNIAGENTAKLPDIRNAQQASLPILDAMRANPAVYGADPLSPAAIDAYSQAFYLLIRPGLAYPLNDRGFAQGTSIWQLLNDNRGALGTETFARGGPRPPFVQAFATAGARFQVIDQNTTAVLVPFEDGADIIEHLRAPYLPLAAQRTLLRRAQRYAINLYTHQLRFLLEQRALEALPCGAYVLDSHYYDSETGLIKRVLPMAPLII